MYETLMQTTFSAEVPADDIGLEIEPFILPEVVQVFLRKGGEY